MNPETPRSFDVLLTSPENQGRLKQVGTAYPTPKGTGYRFTLKVNLPEGAQLLLLPNRSRQPQADAAEE